MFNRRYRLGLEAFLKVPPHLPFIWLFSPKENVPLISCQRGFLSEDRFPAILFSPNMVHTKPYSFCSRKVCNFCPSTSTTEGKESSKTDGSKAARLFCLS